MVCDEQRPCSRCVKRSIGHLCYDETPVNKDNNPGQINTDILRSGSDDVPVSGSTLDIQPVPDHLAQVLPENSNGNHVAQPVARDPAPGNIQSAVVEGTANTENPVINSGGVGLMGAATSNNMLGANSSGRMSSLNQPLFLSEHIGSEFSSLNEFLTMLEDPMLIEQQSPLAQQLVHPTLNGGSVTNFNPTNGHVSNHHVNGVTTNDLVSAQLSGQRQKSRLPSGSPNLLPNDQQPTPKENFFLTAADPSTEINPEDRLKLVINAKLEAGLLQPYNYAKGYSRLQNFMDKYMNQSSKQRILKPLSIIRPAFRAIARSLKDVDLVLVEESFERMLLSYDRVFTSMSMPACLWRRTGEIYRGNKEFASLVDCKVDDLRDGKLAIYELMSEESAVNFWEKYGSIAFDKGQKAVLTSCNLRTRDGRQRRPCCFSFTIRRDRYNIPICIVGNFIPIS